MTHRSMTAVALLALCLPPVARAGEVRGTVRFEGTPPAPARLDATKDREACGETVPDETVQVRDGRLAGVVVIVKGPPAPPPGKVVLDQQRCRYVPHVQAASVGSSLDIVNGDPTLHNVHGYLGQATAFNVAMPTKDHRVTRKLAKPGLVVVRCDVHAWMSAYVVVADAPFATSGEDGTFEVKDVPAGTWPVTAWHEKLGERSGTVTVGATGAATVDFAFGR